MQILGILQHKLLYNYNNFCIPQFWHSYTKITFMAKTYRKLNLGVENSDQALLADFRMFISCMLNTKAISKVDIQYPL